MAIDPLFNRPDNATKISLDIGIGEPQEMYSQRFKSPLPSCIIFSFAEVTGPIDLNRKKKIRTIKVHDISVDRLLPVEVIPPQLLSLESPP